MELASFCNDPGAHVATIADTDARQVNAKRQCAFDRSPDFLSSLGSVVPSHESYSGSTSDLLAHVNHVDK
jgi:hypothetical protein